MSNSAPECSLSQSAIAMFSQESDRVFLRAKIWQQAAGKSFLDDRAAIMRALSTPKQPANKETRGACNVSTGLDPNKFASAMHHNEARLLRSRGSPPAIEIRSQVGFVLASNVPRTTYFRMGGGTNGVRQGALLRKPRRFSEMNRARAAAGNVRGRKI